jgi:tRNA threonylcarbamoyladenosine biosynthesis protein TsaB
MILLALDTCTERLLVGLRDTSSTTPDRWANLDSQGNHARDVLPAAERLLEGRKPDVVGVALGPGSFTGVRIGLATAQGWSAGWGVPLVGLDNLAAMAAAWARLCPDSGAAVMPVIDARKKKFYAALYGPQGMLSPPADRTPAEWVAEARVWDGPIVLSGYQGRLLADALGTLPDRWSVLETVDWCPPLLDQLERGWKSQDVLGPDASPRYLRLSEAEEALRLRSV